jgi:hypothetical protein
MDEKNEASQPRRYTWPRYVLGAVVVWVLLILIWMTALIRRTRDQRDFTQWPATATNSAVVNTNTAPSKTP